MIYCRAPLCLWLLVFSPIPVLRQGVSGWTSHTWSDSLWLLCRLKDSWKSPAAGFYLCCNVNTYAAISIVTQPILQSKSEETCGCLQQKNTAETTTTPVTQDFSLDLKVCRLKLCSLSRHHASSSNPIRNPFGIKKNIDIRHNYLRLSHVWIHPNPCCLKKRKDTRLFWSICSRTLGIWWRRLQKCFVFLLYFAHQ